MRRSSTLNRARWKITLRFGKPITMNYDVMYHYCRTTPRWNVNNSAIVYEQFYVRLFKDPVYKHKGHCQFTRFQSLYLYQINLILQKRCCVDLFSDIASILFTSKRWVMRLFAHEWIKCFFVTRSKSKNGDSEWMKTLFEVKYPYIRLSELARNRFLNGICVLMSWSHTRSCIYVWRSPKGSHQTDMHELVCD